MADMAAPPAGGSTAAVASAAPKPGKEAKAPQKGKGEAKPAKGEKPAATAAKPAKGAPAGKKGAAPGAKQPKAEQKVMEGFRHIPVSVHDRDAVDAPPAELHIAFLRLAASLTSRVYVEATAYARQLIEACREAVRDYVRPAHKAFSWHLNEVLSAALAYLEGLRPLSPAVAAAVRHIKATVARVSPTLSDDEAREAICADLHAYLSERINVAPLLLAASCRSSSSGDDAAAAGSVAPLSAVAAAPPPLHFSLGPGDSVVTYGHASGVEALLKGLHAQLQHTAGAAAAPGSEATSVDSSCAAGSSGAGASTFTVIIVDARPLLSGQTLLAALCAAGIPCVYSHLPALPRLLARRGVRGVLLGAEAVGVDGSVLAASGSALVAAAAAGAGLPVHIVAESWKFGERPLLDAGAGGANAALSSVGVFNPSRTRAPEVLAPPVVSSALSAAVAKAAKAAEAAAKAVGAGAGAGAGAAAAPRAAAAAPKAAGAPKAAAAGAGGKGGSGGKEAEIQPCASSGRIEHDTVVPGPVVFAAHAASSSAAVSSAPAAAASSSSGGGKSGPGGAAASVGFSPLTNWRRKPGIKLLALAADVTPARHVTALLTEAGPLPPAAVHVLLQAFGRLEEHDAEEGEGEDGEGEDEDGEGDYHEGGGEAEDGEVEDGGAPDGEEDVVFAV